MNWRRWIAYLTVDVNSSKGLIIRAEKLEETAEKTRDANQADKFYLYAEVLRLIASKNYPPYKNKSLIDEYLRRPSS